MKRKNVTIVGILFSVDNIEEILDYLEEKKVFNIKDTKQFHQKINNEKDISIIFKSIMVEKKIKNPPVMEILDKDLNTDNFFIGYRINEYPLEIPTNPKQLEEIKSAKEKWFNIFKDDVLIESINFEVY